MSAPSTWPVGPTARASSAVVPPMPQPISMTCSPGWAAAAAKHVLAEIGDRTLDALVVGGEPALPARAVPERGLFGGELGFAFRAHADRERLS